MVCMCGCENKYNAGPSVNEDSSHSYRYSKAMYDIVSRNRKSSIAGKYFVMHKKGAIKKMLEGSKPLPPNLPHFSELYLGISPVSLTLTLLAGADGMEVLNEIEVYLFLKRCHGPGHLEFQEMYRRNRDRFWGVDKYMFYVIEFTCPECNHGREEKELFETVSKMIN